MRKGVLTLVALVAIALQANAQVVKNDLMKGYKPGDKLEKAVYGEKKEAIRVHSWNGAFAAAPVEGLDSPLVGQPLSYEGYKEGGPSIDLGNFPTEVKGNRYSVYSLTDVNKEFQGGTYYLAFLVNFSKLGGAGFADFIGTDINYVGGGYRGKVFVAREGKDKIKFGVGMRAQRTEGVETYDYNKTHLLVMKVDYVRNQVSLFVNPELGKDEPKAVLVSDGEENDLKNGLKGITFRFRPNYKGAIGNFRLATSWAGSIGQ